MTASHATPGRSRCRASHSYFCCSRGSVALWPATDWWRAAGHGPKLAEGVSGAAERLLERGPISTTRHDRGTILLGVEVQRITVVGSRDSTRIEGGLVWWLLSLCTPCDVVYAKDRVGLDSVLT